MPATVDVRRWRLRAVLCAVWAAAAFGASYFARDLRATVLVGGWPFDYWLAAQGTVLLFIGIVACYAWSMNRLERREQALGTATGNADPGADALVPGSVTDAR